MTNVFPQPYFSESSDGLFCFREKLFLILDKSFDNPEFIELSPVLWNQFTIGKTELEIIFREGIGGRARITQNPDDMLISGSTEYEYELTCNAEGIDIFYNETIGMIHAFSTTLQLISAYRRKTDDFSIGFIHIQDKPALKMRGMHLCVFPETKLTFLTKLVRLCGLLKCTHIVLEFWGMINLETEEPLGWPFAYTKEDLAPIFKYGTAFGVEFIPMFNHLGHATQSRFKAGKHPLLNQAPEYEELLLPGGWTWDVHNPETLELLKKIRVALCEIFPQGEYFHIGCDEAYIEDYRSESNVRLSSREFLAHVNQISEHLKTLNRKPIMWADMFLDKFHFPFPYVAHSSDNCEENAKMLAELDQDILIDDWQYYIKEESDGTTKYLAENRNPQSLIISPWDDVEHIRGMIRLAKRHGYLGGIGTTWNTVNHEIRHLLYTACVMWDTDDSKTDACSWETLKGFAAQNLRKLMPANPSYKDAGFLETELFHMVD